MSTLSGMLTGAALAVLVRLLLACSSGAAPAPPPDTPATVFAAAYGEEQLRCVAFAATEQQADLCRYQVHAWWCTHGLPEVCVDGGWRP